MNNQQKTRNQAIALAEKYISTQLPDAKKEDIGNGSFTIGNESRTYVINPAKIFTGLINDDKEEDAVMTLDTFSNQNQTMSEQLIMTSSEGKLMLERTIESDMRILAVKEGLIIAEVPEHTRDSPLFYCPSCREVVKFKFTNGELIRAE